MLQQQRSNPYTAKELSPLLNEPRIEISQPSPQVKDDSPPAFEKNEITENSTSNRDSNALTNVTGSSNKEEVDV